MNKTIIESQLNCAINDNITQPLKAQAETIIKEIEDLISLIMQGSNVASNLEKVEILKVNALNLINGNYALKDVYVKIEDKTELAKAAAKRTKSKSHEALDKLNHPLKAKMSVDAKTLEKNNIFDQILVEYNQCSANKTALAEITHDSNGSNIQQDLCLEHLGMLQPSKLVNCNIDKTKLISKK